MSSKKPSKEILQQIQAEIQEHLTAMESVLLDLDDNPKDAGKIAELFRQMHTIKGIAPVLEIPAMVQVAHSAESYLEEIQEEKGEVSVEDLDLLLQVRDFLLRALAGESVDSAALLTRFQGPVSPESEPMPKNEPAVQAVEAKTVEEEENAGGTFLLFQNGNCICAVSVDRIREVSVSLEVRPVPFAPKSLLGVANLRGQLVSVLDLAELLGVVRQPETLGRILYVEAGEELIGCWVDRVIGVAPLPGWEKSSPALRHFGLDLVEGVASYRGDVVSILSPDKLFQLVSA